MTAKNQTYYTTEETRETLKRIGGGNASKGLRIAAESYERNETLLSELYQIIGELGASEKVLDQVPAAMEGEELPYEKLLTNGE